MRSVTFVGLFIVLLIGADLAHAQRPASPRGEASTQIGGDYEGRNYTGGKWVVVDYGRPILRGRTGMFGEGETYGETANAGAPVWRAGANKSTRFMTEADLKFGEATLPAGEYSLFVDLNAGGWTLIFSNHTAKDNFRDAGDGLWGSYNYTGDKDVLRVPMALRPLPLSFDQFTIAFVDMTKRGGTLAMMWENTMATVDFVQDTMTSGN